MTTANPPIRLIRSLTDLAPQDHGGVIAIGNFDGVHRGHRAVIDDALAIAHSDGVPCGVLTFEPHPRTVFKPEAPVFRLTPETAKAEVLQALGVDVMVSLPFTHDFAAHTAEDFVETILVGGLGAHHVVTGFDFHFGKGRAGTPDYLVAAGRARDFGVTIVTARSAADGRPVASRAIRAALEDGDVEAAAADLGYRWFVIGPVIHGAKRGRDLGYPTANMELPANCRLKHGIYAVRLRVDGVVRDGVASYGRRPQFDNGAPLLETYLFDFDGDLYDKFAAVEFVTFLRPEMAFDGIDALIAQMDADSAAAREALAALTDAPFGADVLRR